VTQRKPANIDFETWIDQQIRDAEAQGEFDDLPGKGKPLVGLDGPHDEMWWVRSWMKREGVSFTPLPLALRREVHDLQDRLDREPTEACVRRVVEELNGRIRSANKMPAIDGPPTTVSPLDVDEVVERWRARRPTEPDPTPEPEPDPTTADADPPTQRRWWRRSWFGVSPSS
jgi:hypothetical protein